MKRLQKKVLEVEAAYEAYERASEMEAKDRLWSDYVQANDAIVPQILEVVARRPNCLLAFDLLEWVTTNKRVFARNLQPYGYQALELLRDFHPCHHRIVHICRTLGWCWDPFHQPATDFLKLASERNSDRAARGYAVFALAKVTKRRAEGIGFREIEHFAEIEQNPKAGHIWLGDANAVFQQAENLFERVLDTYSDCPNYPAGFGLRRPRQTLGEQANIELYECRHLEPGKIAPEIEGDDLNGHRLRLSDFRGSVIVLSFWTSWCGPCMQLLAHERVMAMRLEGKPFGIFGVNGDRQRADAIRIQAEQKITWQSFWNGGETWGGVVAAWNVTGWPTVYVLDKEGVIWIKFVGHGGKRSNKLLDELVQGLM